MKVIQVSAVKEWGTAAGKEQKATDGSFMRGPCCGQLGCSPVGDFPADCGTHLRTVLLGSEEVGKFTH